MTLDRPPPPPPLPAPLAPPAEGLSTMLYDTAKVLGPEPPTLGGVRFRQVQIASRDPATLTCEVYLDGDISVSVPCALAGTHVVPIVLEQGWALQNGSDLVLMGMRNSELPKIRARSTSTAPSVTTEIPWAFGAGAVEDDTDFDGVDTMFDSVNGWFQVLWPGVYEYGVHNFANPSVSGSQSIVRVQLDGSTYIDAWQHNHVGTNAMHVNMASRRRFGAGNTVRMTVSASSGTTFGTSSNEIGAAMWMHYIP